MKIPSMDFRGNKFVNADGTLTDVAQSFFDLMNTVLIKNLGDEGVVVPSEDATNIGIIQNNKTISPTGIETNTCEFGTLIYDSTNNKLKVALNDGSGSPTFKEIVTL